MNINRLALGTVQFGLDYGVANTVGRVQPEDIHEILQQAAAQGINTLDTAIAYGDSEGVLGRAGVRNWEVVTKLPAIPQGCMDIAGWVEAQIEGSLDRLDIDQLHGVMLHRPIELLGDHGKKLLTSLIHLKTQGITRKIGVSVYSPEELSILMETIPIDIVQAPFSIIDRRMVDSGWTRKLKNQGVELHIRSAFLQGLLLMPIHQRPEKFSLWHSIWAEWAQWLDDVALTPLQACLGYVLGIEEIDKVVVGVDNISHLKEIISSTYSTVPSLPNWPNPVDMNLINPARWNQL